MQKLLKYLTTLDWVLAIATIGYGAWTQTWWILGMGVLGLAVAWYSPAKRVQAKLANSTLASRRRAKEAAAAQAAIDAVAESEGDGVPEADPSHSSSSATSGTPSTSGAPRSYAQRLTGYSAVRLHPSKHNRLSASSFNLYIDTDVAGFN
jgi:hypothetical protein